MDIIRTVASDGLLPAILWRCIGMVPTHRFSAAIFVAGIAAACAPNAYGPHYVPTYSGGASRVVGEWCSGHAGPKSRLIVRGPQGVEANFLVIL